MENYNNIYGIKNIDVSKGILNNWKDLDINKDKNTKEIDGNSINYNEIYK